MHKTTLRVLQQSLLANVVSGEIWLASLRGNYQNGVNNYGTNDSQYNKI